MRLIVYTQGTFAMPDQQIWLILTHIAASTTYLHTYQSVYIGMPQIALLEQHLQNFLNIFHWEFEMLYFG